MYIDVIDISCLTAIYSCYMQMTMWLYM